MDFRISSDGKDCYDIRVNFKAARLYRQNFMSDLIRDLKIFTEYEGQINEEDTEKMLGIVWSHLKAKNSSVPDYTSWKNKVKKIDLSILIPVINNLWSILSVPTIKTNKDENERQQMGAENSWNLYRYLARKMKIPMVELDEMTPGELMDIVYYEMKMNEMEENPVYIAKQEDFEDFFN